MLAEDFHAVAFLAVDARHVYHRYVHADVAHIVCLLSIDEAVSMAIAEMTVQAIGVTNWDGCDVAVLVEDSLAAVAYALPCLDVVYLQDGGLQGAHAVDGLVVAGVDAVESKTQATHIQLALWEVLDTCGVADMAQYLMVEGCLQLLATLVEQLELMGGESIEAVIVAAYEVREHTARDDGILMFQLANQFLHVVLRVEAQAMHTSIELDMNRESGHALLLGRLDKRIEQAEGINLWLQVVIEHGLEGGHLRVHDHDVAGDAVLAKGHALIGNCHGEIIHTMVLQGLGDFHGSCAIAIRLDHADELGLWLHESTIVVQVGYYGIEVYLQCSLVYLLHQEFGELVETKLTGTLQEDYLITQ